MSGSQSLLEAESAIYRTVLTMSRAFDDQDWPMVRTCVSDDFQQGESTAPVQGANTIRGADNLLAVFKDFAAQHVGTKFSHILGNTVVTVSAEEGELSGFQTAYHYRADAVSSPISKSGSRVTYRLRREQGAWKIVSFAIVRLWLEGETH